MENFLRADTRFSRSYETLLTERERGWSKKIF